MTTELHFSLNNIPSSSYLDIINCDGGYTWTLLDRETRVLTTSTSYPENSEALLLYLDNHDIDEESVLSIEGVEYTIITQQNECSLLFIDITDTETDYCRELIETIQSGILSNMEEDI